MKYALEVCLSALAVTSFAAAQSAAAPSTPTLRKGISVKMPFAGNAVMVPEADKEDALVVAITQDGKIYLGIDYLTPAQLADNLKADLPSRSDKNLYLKADTRTLYASVMTALEAARTAGVTAPVLLTSQQESAQSERPLTPQGLKVLLGSLPTGTASIAVQLLNSGHEGPTLKINHRDVAWPNLQSMLRQASQNTKTKVVAVKADGDLPFGNIVHTVDECQAAGDQIVLVGPQM
jgi:biopolymer transport protein TolR